MKLTKKQRRVLEVLIAFNGHPSARRLADYMETAAVHSATYSYDEIYGQLRQLEKKGAVSRIRGGRVNKWQATDAGQDALRSTDS